QLAERAIAVEVAGVAARVAGRGVADAAVGAGALVRDRDIRAAGLARAAVGLAVHAAHGRVDRGADAGARAGRARTSSATRAGAALTGATRGARVPGRARR